MGSTTPSRRRWFQFSVRTMLVIIAVASIGLAVNYYQHRQQQVGRQQRLAVKMLQTLGGRITYDYQSLLGTTGPTSIPGDSQWLPDLLGDDVYATVAEIELTNGGASPSDLQHVLMFLEAFPQLKTVNLANTQLDDAGLADLQNLTQLESLNLASTKITDAGLAGLSRLSQLEELNLFDTAITDQGLATLQGMPRLKRLNLWSTQITDAGLASLAGVSQLEELHVGDTPITDAGLGQIAPLSGLRKLNLAYTSITDAGLLGLQPMKQLEMLDVAATPITNQGLANLQRLPGLTGLNLWQTPVDDAGLKSLQAWPRLQEVGLGNTPVTDAGLASLKSLTQLQYLCLMLTKITDAGLPDLRGLSRLKSLDLSGNQLGEQDCQQLIHALPAIECATYSSPHVTASPYAAIPSVAPVSTPPPSLSSRHPATRAVLENFPHPSYVPLASWDPIPPDPSSYVPFPTPVTVWPGPPVAFPSAFNPPARSLLPSLPIPGPITTWQPRLRASVPMPAGPFPTAPVSYYPIPPVYPSATPGTLVPVPNPVTPPQQLTPPTVAVPESSPEPSPETSDEASSRPKAYEPAPTGEAQVPHLAPPKPKKETTTNST